MGHLPHVNRRQVSKTPNSFSATPWWQRICCATASVEMGDLNPIAGDFRETDDATVDLGLPQDDMQKNCGSPNFNLAIPREFRGGKLRARKNHLRSPRSKPVRRPTNLEQDAPALVDQHFVVVAACGSYPFISFSRTGFPGFIFHCPLNFLSE